MPTKITLCGLKNLKNEFLIEISVKEDGKIIELDTEDMEVNISQRCDGRMERMLEIKCSSDDKGKVHTDVEWPDDALLGIDRGFSEQGITITSVN